MRGVGRGRARVTRQSPLADMEESNSERTKEFEPPPDGAMATESEEEPVSIWKTLMKSGQPIDVEMLNYDGLTPLHAAVMSHNSVVKELRHLENPCLYMTKEMVQRKQTYVECIKILLFMGASIGSKDLKSGRTCLHMAAEEANVELFNILLDQPTSLSIVNVKTFSGNTALHVVSSLQNHKSQVEAVKLLMRKGADPGTRNFENELPSQLTPEGLTGEKVRQILKGKYCHA